MNQVDCSRIGSVLMIHLNACILGTQLEVTENVIAMSTLPKGKKQSVKKRIQEFKEEILKEIRDMEQELIDNVAYQ